MGRLLAAGLVVIVALVAVLVVNGEGPNKPEDKEADTPAQESTQATPPAEETEEPEPGGEPGSHGTPAGATVRMKQLRFRPAAVSVEVGQDVRFVNDDNVAHTVFQDFGPRSGQTPAVDSARILPGETFSFTVRSDGLIAYVCTLHPSVMVGQVLAEKPAS